MKPGDNAQVVGKHPHKGAFVLLLSFGRYGLDILNLTGWLVRRESGEEFYCKSENLKGTIK
jgi:hypothetical protein